MRTQLSVRTMAASQKVGSATVQRIWKKHNAVGATASGGIVQVQQ